MKLLFFAKSRELSGVSNTVISVPTLITGAQLLETVLSLYPRCHDVCMRNVLQSGIYLQ